MPKHIVKIDTALHQLATPLEIMIDANVAKRIADEKLELALNVKGHHSILVVRENGHNISKTSLHTKRKSRSMSELVTGYDRVRRTKEAAKQFDYRKSAFILTPEVIARKTSKSQKQGELDLTPTTKTTPPITSKVKKQKKVNGVRANSKSNSSTQTTSKVNGSSAISDTQSEMTLTINGITVTGSTEAFKRLLS